MIDNYIHAMIESEYTHDDIMSRLTNEMDMDYFDAQDAIEEVREEMENM